MAVDQEEIARALSLSRSTVSRSLSGHPAIHPDTRARVLATAHDLGYRVREHNRGRRATPNKIATFGVLIATGSFEHSPHPEAGQEMLSGLSDAASSRDIMLDTHFFNPGTPSSLDHPESRPAGWRHRTWRGAILLYQHPADLVAQLSADLPVVSLVHQYTDLAIDCIDTDPAHGMDLLIERLAAAGHRRIGFVNRLYKSPQQPSWIFSRFAGYIQALTQKGLAFDPAAVVNVLPGPRFPHETLPDEVIRLRQQAGITAFVCAADHQTFLLQRGLTQRGLEVPRDLSLTGFDGTPVPSGLPPPATIRSPLREMGTGALRRLINRVQDPSQPVRHILHHGRLIEGATIAPPSL